MVAAVAADVERRLELVVPVVRVALRARVRMVRGLLDRRSVTLLDRDVDALGHAASLERGGAGETLLVEDAAADGAHADGLVEPHGAGRILGVDAEACGGAADEREL